MTDPQPMALAAAAALARQFPELRPAGIPRFLERAAAELGDDDEHVPDDLLAEGLARLPRGEAARIAQVFATWQPVGWRQLCADAGGRRDAELAIARGAIRAAICERRARPRLHLAEIEDARDLLLGEPLALALDGRTIWAITDAFGAVTQVPAPDEDEEAWIAAADAVEVDGAIRRRLRAAARRLHRQLPIRSLPRATRLLRRDLAAVERRDGVADRAAGLLLLQLAASLPRPDLSVSLN